MEDFALQDNSIYSVVEYSLSRKRRRGGLEEVDDLQRAGG